MAVGKISLHCPLPRPARTLKGTHTFLHEPGAPLRRPVPLTVGSQFFQAFALLFPFKEEPGLKQLPLIEYRPLSLLLISENLFFNTSPSKQRICSAVSSVLELHQKNTDLKNLAADLLATPPRHGQELLTQHKQNTNEVLMDMHLET